MRYRDQGSATLLVAALAAILAAGELQSGEARRVAVRTPTKRTYTRVLKYPGTAMAYQKAVLEGRVQGYVKEVGVFEGDVVDGETVLARIDVPDLEADVGTAAATLREARAMVEKAAAGRDISRATLSENEAAVRVCEADFQLRDAVAKRRKKLVQSGAETAEGAEEAAAAAAVARARCDAAFAAVELARALVKDALAMIQTAAARVKSRESALRRCEVLVGFATIRSPYASAVVTARSVDPGALVRADGTAIVTVMDVSRIRVLVHVAERDALVVRRGQSVELRLDADPTKPIPSTLTRTSGALDSSSRTMRAEIEIPNPDGKILPGMYCHVSITVASRPNALFLPASAVLSDAGRHFVLVVQGEKGSQSVRRVDIETGFADGVEVEVVSGLDGNALVVDGKPDLQDGDQVITEAGGKS